MEKSLSKNDILENHTYYKRCIKLLLADNNITKKEIAKLTEDSITNTNIFTPFIKFLLHHRFLSVDKNRIPFIYNVNKYELAMFLRKSRLFDEWAMISKLTNKLYSI
jgi:hypothetical protein